MYFLYKLHNYHRYCSIMMEKQFVLYLQNWAKGVISRKGKVIDAVYVHPEIDHVLAAVPVFVVTNCKEVFEDLDENALSMRRGTPVHLMVGDRNDADFIKDTTKGHWWVIDEKARLTLHKL